MQRQSLKQIPLFSSMSDAALSTISEHIRLVEYKKGDIVYSQSDMADAFYIILSGRCRTYIVDADNSEMKQSYLFKGDYFGAVSLLIEKPQAMNVQAVNDTIGS